MTSMDLDVMLTLHQKVCPRCRAGKACRRGFEAFDTTADTLLRTPDPKRAKA